MKCLYCESAEGVSTINGMHICTACRKKYYSTCSHCKGELPDHFFYMRKSNILTYILTEYKYERICGSCSDAIEKEVKEKGVSVCVACGELHTYISAKVDGICKRCEDSLNICHRCGKYHLRGHGYSVEDNLFVCTKCYSKHMGEYLDCSRCGVFHIIIHSHTYKHPRYLCKKCKEKHECEICDICGNTHSKPNMITSSTGDIICRHCSKYKCDKCGRTPIRPRRVGEDDKLYCSTCAGSFGSAVKQSWNYIPSKFHFHDVVGDTDKLYLGFENEQIIPTASSNTSRVDLANVLAHFKEEDIYGVFDGSIGGQEDSHGSNGYEIVSHPRTLSSHKEMDWGYLFSAEQEIHQTCGMHVHMSRSGFSRVHLLHLMQMIYMNTEFIDLVAEREPNEYTQSISTDMISADADAMYKKKNSLNRRVKVNLCNKHTIELRFYANVINQSALMKNIEFTHALYYYTEKSKDVSVRSFLSWVAKSELYPNLTNFIAINAKEFSECV